MRQRHIWSIVAFVSGALCLLLGISLIGMYVFSAIIEPLGQPDQSLLFWLVPFLLIGLAATVCGIVLLLLGVILRRGTTTADRMRRGTA